MRTLGLVRKQNKNKDIVCYLDINQIEGVTCFIKKSIKSNNFIALVASLYITRNYQLIKLTTVLSVTQDSQGVRQCSAARDKQWTNTTKHKPSDFSINASFQHDALHCATLTLSVRPHAALHSPPTTTTTLLCHPLIHLCAIVTHSLLHLIH